MNAAFDVTVHWLPELAPSVEARATALETFERQTGSKPKTFIGSASVGVWGFISADAALLFRVPENWAPPSETPPDVTDPVE